MLGDPPQNFSAMQRYFDYLPIWGVFLAVLLISLVAIETGFRRGQYVQRRAEQDQEKEAPVGAMVGATLGLLAFLLAITFGIAEDSFHARKVAVLEEANEVRAAYLRTEFIPEPHRTEVRRILREYVDERLQWAGVLGSHAPLKSRALLDQLWEHAGAAEKVDPSSNGISLFVESVNRVISCHEERLMLRERSRIPTSLSLVLLLMAILSFAGMGYHGGVAGTTRSPVMVVAALSFSLVIMLIADLNRPGQGWINVSQDAMIDLRLSLKGSGH
jgi:hypothetical protein